MWYLIVSIPDLCTLTYFAVYTGVPLSNKLDANMAQRIHIKGDVFPQLCFLVVRFNNPFKNCLVISGQFRICLVYHHPIMFVWASMTRG